jgi:hypothetical protein
MTPELNLRVKLRIRQLFPTVAASLDDSHIARETQEIAEETEQVVSRRHRGCGS